jgi:hypothetical protein
MRRLAGALLTLVYCALSQASTTVTTDYSDLWWNADEPGWGANVIQQGDTLFVTLFIYDSQHNPTWLVAPATAYQGQSTFSGPLYQTKGSWYVETFNPAASASTALGALTFQATGVSSAVLTYNVGGFVITKKLVRLTWRSDGLAGLYLGAREGTWNGCGDALNGKVDSFASIGISQQGDDIQIRDAGNRYTCSYTGKIGQTGRFAVIEGMGVCDDHVNRFLQATEVQVSQIGFSMRYRMEAVGTDCTFTGYLGGMRQLP